MTTEQRILKFLEDYPNGTLQVAVAYTSIWGLSWLNQNTEGRRTNLLIGNIPDDSLAGGSANEREDALDFLDRPDVTVSNWNAKLAMGFGGPEFGLRSDVTVSNWKTKGKGKAHISAWLVLDKNLDKTTHRLLIGSANLKKTAIMQGNALMVEVADTDMDAVVGKMRGLYDTSWNCRNTLLRSIEANDRDFCNWG